jgi:phage terminase small subunit
MDTRKKKLNQRQTEFCMYYVRCGNASEAARLAGYKGNVDVHSARLLVKASIKEEIKRLSKNKVKEFVNAKELRRYWAELLRNADADEKNRLKASELIGKSLGLFLERREITSNSKIVILPEEK